MCSTHSKVKDMQRNGENISSNEGKENQLIEAATKMAQMLEFVEKEH